MRTCTECGEAKELIEFPSYKTNHNKSGIGYQTRCKPCYNEYHRRWRKEQGDKYRDKQSQRHRDRVAALAPDELKKYRRKMCNHKNKRHREDRLAALDAYGGPTCVCCGENTEMFLCIDHINNNGGAHRKEIGNSGSRLYQWLRINGYPEGFQVLCYNCNNGKRLNNGVCPHHDSRCNDYPERE